ncbi:MAG: urease accessory protein UreF [Methylovirgula sp.]
MLTTLIAMSQADSAFPNGAFAFSNGIEGLAGLLLPFDRDQVRRHVETAIRHRWAGTDRVALTHAFHAHDSIPDLHRIDLAYEAATLPASLRQGSRRAGRAFLVSHGRLATAGAGELQEAVTTGRIIGHLPVVQGAIWRGLEISLEEAIAISGFQTLTGLVSAAVRLGSLGAIDAQAIIRDLLPLVADFAKEQLSIDQNVIMLSSFSPLLEIAAMRGGTAKLRLFSN